VAHVRVLPGALFRGALLLVAFASRQIPRLAVMFFALETPAIAKRLTEPFSFAVTA
jgi:hypothetical protein